MSQRSLQDFLLIGEYVTIPHGATSEQRLPEEMKGITLDTDIWRIDALNAPTSDCTFHPDGYCLSSAGVNYIGPTMIACQPPFAYIRYKHKGVCV